MSAPLSGSTVTSSVSLVRCTARHPCTRLSRTPSHASVTSPPDLTVQNAIAFTARVEPAAPVALVTGAANGIGRAIALRLQRDGFRVAAADIEPVGPADGVTGYVLDVSDLDAHEPLVSRLEQELGPLAALVN